MAQIPRPRSLAQLTLATIIFLLLAVLLKGVTARAAPPPRPMLGITPTPTFTPSPTPTPTVIGTPNEIPEPATGLLLAGGLSLLGAALGTKKLASRKPDRPVRTDTR